MPHNLAGQIILEDMFSAPLSNLARLSQQAETALRQMGGTADTAAGTAAHKLQALESTLDELKQKAQSGGTMTVLDVNQFRKLSREAETLRNGLDQMNSSGQSVARTLADMAGINLGPLAGGLTAAAAAFVAMKAAKEGWELYQLGAQAQRIGNSFQEMASSVGASGGAMLAALRKASRGTITDTDLMLTANRAMMLGVTSDAETMARLLEVAMVRGQRLGRAPLDAFNDVATGIGRMSAPILDNLGIVTGGEQAFKAYAESIGKTASELTDLEKRQFLVNKVLSDTSKLTQDAQMGIEQMRTAWANWRSEAGQALAGVSVDLGITKSISNAAEAARIARETKAEFDRLQGMQLPVGALEAWKTSYTGIQILLQTGHVEQAAAQWARLKDEIEKATAVNASPVILGLTGALAGLASTLPAVSENLRAGTSEALAFAQALEKIGNAAGSAAKSTALGMVGYVGEASALKLYRDRQAAVDDYIRSNSKLGKSNDEIEFGLRGLQSGWEKYDDAVRKAANADERKTAATHTLKSALTGLDSKIRTALTAGLEVTPGDMFATNAGAYQDAALESARRLNAIAQRGFEELRIHPDWAGLLKIPPEVLSGSEEQLRAWASSTSASVQDLSRPDLINWDAFIGNFKAQLDKEQAQKLTLDIAVNKLDEAGLLAGLGGDEKARRDKVAEALGLKAPKITLEALLEADKNAGSNLISSVYPPKGVATIPATYVPAAAGTTTTTQPPLTAPGTTSTGAALAGSLYTEFTTTIAGQNVGAAVYTAWNTSLTAKKSLEDFGTIGTALGTTVAGAFVVAMKDGVGNVRRDIASIVAPEVAKILASQQPRTNLP